MKRLQILLVGLVLIGVVLTIWWRRSPYFHEVRTATTFVAIHAPADKVFATLTDFEHYRDWNPYIIRAQVTASSKATGSASRIKIVEVAGQRSHTHRVVVTRWEKNAFSWSGSTWPGWLLNWTETFEVTPVGANESELAVQQSYQGFLLRAYWNYFNPHNLAAVKAMAVDLKKRVEPR